jgi:hypothetical protein
VARTLLSAKACSEVQPALNTQCKVGAGNKTKSKNNGRGQECPRYNNLPKK